MPLKRERCFYAALLIVIGVWLGMSIPKLAQADAPKAKDPQTSPPQVQQVQPLPTIDKSSGGDVTEVFVSGGNRVLFKIAVPPLFGGEPTVSNTVVETATRDLTLSSLFQVLDPKSFTADLGTEGLGIDVASWRNVGAEGVIKGTATIVGKDTYHLELRLYVVSRGANVILKHTYTTAPGAPGIRAAVHQFGNEIVKWFTGTAGTFGSRLVYSSTLGQTPEGGTTKGIFSIGSDGKDVMKLSTEGTITALAPAVGPDGTYYAGGTTDGAYSLFRVGNPVAVLRRAGLIFGVAFGGSKMAIVVAQNGQSDIYTGAVGSDDLKKVTSGGINTHPSLSSGGRLAYVSNGGGNPQIYVDGTRVSWRGNYNMAPAWCNDPEGTKILFMGRDGGVWDVFSVDPGGSQVSMVRLTQDQGSNTYPACSPDGRMVAFFSTRGGLYISNPHGQNQQPLATAFGESLRWQ